eukprot:GILK01013515.1.p1 GENE.GILK01013515.1~~GILK01013515.1.p1  ORF type:complete len:547 (+),score=68.80 GILK01013515.1:664-2304(+)
MLFPALFLYQSIVSSSLKVVLYSPMIELRSLCAILFLLVGFGVPGAVYSIIGPGFTAEYRLRVDEDAAAGIVRKKPSGAVFMIRYLFQPTGRWAHDDPYWLTAYGTVFDEFQWRGSHRFQWFVMVDVVVTFTLGLVDGIEPEDLDQCYGRLIVSVLAFFSQFILVLIYRPYITRFLNGFYIFVYFLQFMSMLLVAVAVLNNTPQYDGVKIAVNLLLFFSILLMIKSLIDITMLINEHFGIAEMFMSEDKQELKYRAINETEAEEVKAQILQQMFDEQEQDYGKTASGKSLLDPEDSDEELLGIGGRPQKKGAKKESAFAPTGGNRDRGLVTVKSEILNSGGRRKKKGEEEEVAEETTIDYEVPFLGAQDFEEYDAVEMGTPASSPNRTVGQQGSSPAAALVPFHHSDGHSATTDDLSAENYDEDEDGEHYYSQGGEEDSFDPADYFKGKYRNPRTVEEAFAAEDRRRRGLLEVDRGYKSTPAHLRQPRVSEQLKEYLVSNKERRAIEASSNNNRGQSSSGQPSRPQGGTGRRRRHEDDDDDGDFEL